MSRAHQPRVQWKGWLVGGGCVLLLGFCWLVLGVTYVVWMYRAESAPELVQLPEPAVEPAPEPEPEVQRRTTMTVCAEERKIRVHAPVDTSLKEAMLYIEPGDQVGLVHHSRAPTGESLARYGWVAEDRVGGILRWWQPDDFADFDEAEQTIRQVLAYCEVCCAAGTVVEQDGGGRTVWLQDDRFELPSGHRIGQSFQAVAKAAPAGAQVVEDPMEGQPTIDLGGVTAYGALDRDEVTMLVARLGPR